MTSTCNEQTRGVGHHTHSNSDNNPAPPLSSSTPSSIRPLRSGIVYLPIWQRLAPLKISRASLARHGQCSPHASIRVILLESPADYHPELELEPDCHYLISFKSLFEPSWIHQWVSASTTLLQCVSNGAMSLLHQPIDNIFILYAEYNMIWMKHVHAYANKLNPDLWHGHYKTLHIVTLDSLKINKKRRIFCSLQLNTFLWWRQM